VRVLILTCNTGGGHNAVAALIVAYEILRRKYHIDEKEYAELIRK